jgi:CheY-like chemotaxis protein
MHVLLVEDDEATRFIVERTLHDLGRLQVTSAPNGEEALSILGAQRVDAVVSDYRMPGRNGLEVLCHARQAQPHARRVLMSGTLREDIMRLQGGAACADFVFEKPDKREEWRDLLSLALGLASLK